MDPFQLESWSVCEDGFSVVGRVEEVLLDGAYLMKSVIAGQQFRTYFLEEGPEIGDEITLLVFSLTCEGTTSCAHQSCDSRWFVRAASCLEGVGKVRDLCAGLGGMSQGAKAASFDVVGSVEIQTATCRILGINSTAPVVSGDICHPRTVFQVWQAAPGPAGVIAGFCCQPFSAFGDRKAQHDDRSRTLPGTLLAAHWLQAPFVLLECVEPAGHNPWVQETLQAHWLSQA